jgi:hypothetical protein
MGGIVKAGLPPEVTAMFTNGVDKAHKSRVRAGTVGTGNPITGMLGIPCNAGCTYMISTRSPAQSGLTRLALALALGLAAIVPALAAPPSDADINRLLSASRAQSMLDTMLPQMEAMQRQQFQQVAEQRQLDDARKAQLQRIEQRSNETIRKALSWQQLRPMYVELYKKTFSKEDVLAMAEFYESPAGQSLLDKTPALMQDVMVAIQARLQPLFVDLQKDLNAIVNEETAPAAAPAPAKK